MAESCWYQGFFIFGRLLGITKDLLLSYALLSLSFSSSLLMFCLIGEFTGEFHEFGKKRELILECLVDTKKVVSVKHSFTSLAYSLLKLGAYT